MAITKLQALVSALNAYGIDVVAATATTSSSSPLQPLITALGTYGIYLQPKITESTSGTVITPGLGLITDRSGNVFTLTSKGEASENGVLINGGGGTSKIEYYSHVTYFQDSVTLQWYTWNGTTFTQASAPTSSNPTPTPTPTPISTPTPTPTPTPTSGTSKWYQNPGKDGMFWKQPIQTTAQWITSGSLISSLRNGKYSSPTGTINLKGNFAAPWIIGQASDPLVTVTDGHKSIQVHVPAGTIVEGPASPWDQSIGGADATKPYLVWSISGATINTGTVQNGSIITGTYGFQIDDGSGNIMCDAVTGQLGSNNSIGGIQDLELTNANASANYVIPHMLAFQLDPSQASGTIKTWPLNIIDTSLTFTGFIPQGVTIGIPASVARPSGMTRGFYMLFDNLQQFGWFNYNFGAAGCTFITCYSNLSTNSSLVSDLTNSISHVMQYVCILSNQTGMSSIKGYAPGGKDAYPAPPLLDLSATNGNAGSLVPTYPSSY